MPVPLLQPPGTLCRAFLPPLPVRLRNPTPLWRPTKQKKSSAPSHLGHSWYRCPECRSDRVTRERNGDFVLPATPSLYTLNSSLLGASVPGLDPRSRGGPAERNCRFGAQEPVPNSPHLPLTAVVHTTPRYSPPAQVLVDHEIGACRAAEYMHFGIWELHAIVHTCRSLFSDNQASEALECGVIPFSARSCLPSWNCPIFHRTGQSAIVRDLVRRAGLGCVTCASR